MADVEGKREAGATLMFVGLSVLVVDLLVVFFLPAALRASRHTAFLGIVIALAFLGVALITKGRGMRGKGETE
jgi:hypothetical protein